VFLSVCHVNFLDAGVLKIADVDISLRINCHPNRPDQLTGHRSCPSPDGQHLAVGRELLDGIIRSIRDIDSALLINGRVGRAGVSGQTCQLEWVPFGKELAAGGEFDKPGPQVIHDIVIADVDGALAVQGDIERAVEWESVWATREWHAGRGGEPGSGSRRAPSTGRHGYTPQYQEDKVQTKETAAFRPVAPSFWLPR
jgi:hypothetical protein